MNDWIKKIEALEAENKKLKTKNIKHTTDMCNCNEKVWTQQKQITDLQRENKELMDCVKAGYKKHWLDDDSELGWEELGNLYFNTLCNIMGDDGYQKWLKEQKR